MKKYRERKALSFFFSLILVLSFFEVIKFDDLKMDGSILTYNYNINLKTAGYWDLTGTPIDIDDSDPAKNWSSTASTYDWCSGNGTWSNPYIIENVIIDGLRTGNCITIKNSKSVFFIIRNCTLFHAEKLGYWGAIYLEQVNNGILINNTCLDTDHGIVLIHNCDNNTIKDNIAKDNEYGIELWDECDNNNISNNLVKHNRYLGIWIRTHSNNNTIFKNHLENTYEPQDHWCGGIGIDASDDNKIIENIMINNINNGIVILSDNCYDNIVHNNTICNNGLGIQMRRHAIGTIITENIIMDNGYGIFIESFPSDNNIYLNKFIGNSIQAYDNSLNDNYWDNGAIGNYWDDYNGTDIGDDGIGDSPYIIEGDFGGDQDNYPIWHDSPNIWISSPYPSEIFELTAPAFNMKITDPNLESMWYTLNYGTQKVPFTSNESVNQELWNLLSDGLIVLTFYANDTAGNINSSSVMIIKDTGPPSIEINEPKSGDVFGSTTPTFNVEIKDFLLNTTWYTIDGGLSNFTFTSNGSINVTAWENAFEGVIIILFYANDTLGKVNSTSVLIYKDTKSPYIQIVSPTYREEFGVTAPDFIVEFDEVNVVEMWYTIDDGLNNYTFTTNGTINQGAWNAAPESDINFRVYIKDLVGNLGEDFVIITKRLTPDENGTNGTTDQFAIPSYHLNLLIIIIWITSMLLLSLLMKKLKRN